LHPSAKKINGLYRGETAMGVKICASILSANYLKLGEELKKAEDAGCDYIHVDVMDGNYVDNMAVGLCVAKWLPMGTKLRLDAHLAVSRPQDFIEAFADAGMNAILFHPDSYPHHMRLIEKIKNYNMLAGIALAPSTSLESVSLLLPHIDIVDQLAVDAGFPNQKYNTTINQKLIDLKLMKERHGYTYEIQVDGGINESTAKMAADAGAEVLISGSTLFESSNMEEIVKRLRE